MMPGTNKTNGVAADITIYIRDLLYKEIISEEDLIIIEDTQNTKQTTVRDFVRSIIKDDDVPTKYRIYSSLKIREMIDAMDERLDKGIGQCQDLVEKLDIEKADITQLEELEDALIAEIDKCIDEEVVLEMIDSKRDKNIKIKSDDLDTSSDDVKIKMVNLSQEVIDAMTGAAVIPSNRPPVGGWVTEDFADNSVNHDKLSEHYSYGGHYIEGNINEFMDTGVYSLGYQVLGLPREDEDDQELRLLFVTSTDNDIIVQYVYYINDLEYRPIYRRVATRNRLRVTEFIRVEEINSKFKAHRDLLSDDFNNCGVLSEVDLFTITREGHYLADASVSNLPTRDEYQVDIRKFGDVVIYQAIAMAATRCDVFQAKQYYTTGENPVTTDWFNISSFSRSKFEGKTVHLFGDGILFGLGSDDIPNKSIPALLSTKYGFRVINNALGDATAGGYDDETLAERSVVTQVSLDTMDDADYVVIMVGTHDWDSAKSEIGTDDSASDRTFKGSLNVIIQNILRKNARTKILLCSPFFRSRIKTGDNKNSDDYSHNDLLLRDFAVAMEEIAILNHIPFLNLYDTSGINKFNSTAYLKDGLYLNDEGHELIATKIMDAMEKYY